MLFRSIHSDLDPDAKDRKIKATYPADYAYLLSEMCIRDRQEGIETNKHNFTRFLVVADPWQVDELNRHRSKDVNKASMPRRQPGMLWLLLMELNSMQHSLAPGMLRMLTSCNGY